MARKRKKNKKKRIDKKSERMGNRESKLHKMEGSCPRAQNFILFRGRKISLKVFLKHSVNVNRYHLEIKKSQILFLQICTENQFQPGNLKSQKFPTGH